MALPTIPTDSWTQGLDFPSRLFGTGFGGNDYELYEQDGEFVLRRVPSPTRSVAPTPRRFSSPVFTEDLQTARRETGVSSS